MFLLECWRCVLEQFKWTGSLQRQNNIQYIIIIQSGWCSILAQRFGSFQHQCFQTCHYPVTLFSCLAEIFPKLGLIRSFWKNIAPLDVVKVDIFVRSCPHWHHFPCSVSMAAISLFTRGFSGFFKRKIIAIIISLNLSWAIVTSFSAFLFI